MKYGEAYRGIMQIQRKLLADAMDGETTASARAQVARAYTDAEAMKRIMRGKANPKPVDVPLTSRGSARRASSVRPLPPRSDPPSIQPTSADTPQLEAKSDTQTSLSSEQPEQQPG